MKELEGISENHCEIMHHITRHVLSIISLKVIKEHGDEARVNLEDLDEIDKPSKVIGIIEQWLLHEACVGHVKFGGLYLKKFDEEVRVSILKFYIITALICQIDFKFYAGMASIMQGHCLS